VYFLCVYIVFPPASIVVRREFRRRIVKKEAKPLLYISSHQIHVHLAVAIFKYVQSVTDLIDAVQGALVVLVELLLLLLLLLGILLLHNVLLLISTLRHGLVLPVHYVTVLVRSEHLLLLRLITLTLYVVVIFSYSYFALLLYDLGKTVYYLAARCFVSY